MKRITLLYCFFTILFLASAQAQVASGKLSPHTKTFLLKMNQKDISTIQRKFLYTDSTFNEENIKAIGGNVVVYTDKIKTFSVPVKSIPLLIQIKGITYIEIGKKAKIK